MSKSAGNGFLPGELFSGDHPLLNRGYSPMTVKFFMLQAHYRSTLDFSNDALEASDKGFKRLMAAYALLPRLHAGTTCDVDVESLRDRCYAAMNDDFNSPILIAELFEAARTINSVNDGKASIDEPALELLKQLMHDFIENILGLTAEDSGGSETGPLMDLIIGLRQEAKAKKDFAVSDKIRETLSELGIQLKDGKEGTTWSKL